MDTALEKTGLNQIGFAGNQRIGDYLVEQGLARP